MFKPFNRYVQVKPVADKKKEKKKKDTFEVPKGFAPKKKKGEREKFELFEVVEFSCACQMRSVGKYDHCDDIMDIDRDAIEKGDVVLIETSMLEEAEIDGKTVMFIKENYIAGKVKEQ